MKKFLSVFLFTCYLNAQWGGWGSNSTPDWGGNTTVDDGGGVTPIDCEWIVTNTNDSGTGSLRQMISDASSGDTICFDPSLYGETIHLSTGALEINKSLTILGYPFANIIISADSLSRVIETTSGSPTIILRNLRITKGLYDGTAARGGAINIDEDDVSLTIDSCIVDSSIADAGTTAGVSGGGAIAMEETGTLLIKNSVISYNTSTRTTQSDPRQSYGSAIGLFNFASNTITAEIRNCAIFSNTMVGVVNNASHGAVGYSGGNITYRVYNSVFSNNSVNRSGCPSSLQSPKVVIGCTFYLDNPLDAGSILMDASSDSIIGCVFYNRTSNPDVSSGTVSYLRNTIFSRPNNFIASSEANTFYDTYTSLNWMGEWEQFGGLYGAKPAYHSEAIDGGIDLSAYGITTDIRGKPRPAGDGWDIGAIELTTAEIDSLKSLYKLATISTNSYSTSSSAAATIMTPEAVNIPGRPYFLLIKRITTSGTQSAYFTTDKHEAGTVTPLNAGNEATGYITSCSRQSFTVGSALTGSGNSYGWVLISGDSALFYTRKYVGDGTDDRVVSTNVASPGLAIVKRDSTHSAIWKTPFFGTDSSFAFVVPDGKALISDNKIQELGEDYVEVGSDSSVNLNGRDYYLIVLDDSYVRSIRYTGSGATGKKAFFAEHIAGLDFVSIHENTTNTTGHFWFPYSGNNYTSGNLYTAGISPVADLFQAVNYRRVIFNNSSVINELDKEYYGFAFGLSNNFIVTSLNDVASTTWGTLRRAIAKVEWDDTISFSPSIEGGKIDLTTYLQVEKSVRIIADSIILRRAPSSSRILQTSTLGMDYIFEGLTLLNGWASGASARGANFYAQRFFSVAFEKCVIDSGIINNTSSTAGGIVHFGYESAHGDDTMYVSINNCVFKNNQTRNNGTTNSVAGTIKFANTSKIIHATINNSAIINNSGTTTSSRQIQGIGIANSFASNIVYVKNTTISGNTCQLGAAGILTVSSPFYIYNSTITNNISAVPATYGGGIHNNVTELRNTIVAGNTNDFIACTATNVAYSIIGSTSGLTITNDLGGNQLNTDPLLDAIQQYGHTWCHPFGSDDPPYNSGTDLSAYGITTDQRGVLRPQNTTYDVGAFELE